MLPEQRSPLKLVHQALFLELLQLFVVTIERTGLRRALVYIINKYKYMCIREGTREREREREWQKETERDRESKEQGRVWTRARAGDYSPALNCRKSRSSPKLGRFEDETRSRSLRRPSLKADDCGKKCFKGTMSGVGPLGSQYSSAESLCGATRAAHCSHSWTALGQLDE